MLLLNKSRMKPTVTVIITTYNWPEALNLVLESLESQTVSAFEVIIADDGSTAKTKTLVGAWQQKGTLPITHVWQKDEGFQAARIRNKAAAKAQGNYFIFIDGDCMVPPYFVERHLKLAFFERFVSGNRILASDKFTQALLTKKSLPLPWRYADFKAAAKRKDINRAHSMLTCRLHFWRDYWPNSIKGVKTCNLGVSRKNFFAVNGFDESFTGWGYEDADFAVRLMRAGIKKRSATFYTPVLHSHHKRDST
jgi:glycosyltransferase involved in cell wall biosynthesis